MVYNCPGHELVLFDINRVAGIGNLLSNDPRAGIGRMLNNPDLPFGLGVVTNKNAESRGVVIRQKKAGDPRLVETDLNMTWPDRLYSLSHIALPFSMNDPLYGASAAGTGTGLRLGNIVVRGERGVLLVSASAMLRVRSNPFYPYLERRLLAFMLPSDG